MKFAHLEEIAVRLHAAACIYKNPANNSNAQKGQASGSKWQLEKAERQDLDLLSCKQTSVLFSTVLLKLSFIAYEPSFSKLRNHESAVLTHCAVCRARFVRDVGLHQKRLTMSLLGT